MCMNLMNNYIDLLSQHITLILYILKTYESNLKFKFCDKIYSLCKNNFYN